MSRTKQSRAHRQNGSKRRFRRLSSPIKGADRSPSHNVFEPTVAEKSLINEIVEQFRKGDLVMLVGGGVSIPAGLPTWKELIQRLARYDGEADVEFNDLAVALGDDLPTIASFLRSHLTSNFGDSKWYEAVHSALYERFALDESLPYPSLEQRLIVAISNLNSHQIWTTNYDDLLERAFSGTDLTNFFDLSITDPYNRHLNSKPSLKVNHLHGFLPFDEEYLRLRPNKGFPILSSDDYVGYQATPSRPDGWVQASFLSLFDSYNVLILGMSLRDPNLRNALAYTRGDNTSGMKERSSSKKHFAVLSDPDPSNRSLTQGSRLQQIVETYWGHYDVSVLGIPSRSHTASFLARVHFVLGGDKLINKSCIRASGLAKHSLFSALLHEHLSQIDLNLENQNIAVDDAGICLLERGSKGAHHVRKHYSVKDGHRYGKAWNASIDDFTGAAGICFTHCQNILATVNQDVFDYRLKWRKPKSFNTICCVPLVDWSQGGLHVGVLYSTLTIEEDLVIYLEKQVDVSKLSAEMQRAHEELLESISAIITRLTLIGSDLLRRI